VLFAGAVLAGCGPPSSSGPSSSEAPSSQAPGSGAPGSGAPGSGPESSGPASSEPESSEPTGSAPSSGAGPDGSTGAAPGGPELTSPGHNAEGTRAVPVYYVGHTSAGDRLYREFHQVRAGAGEELGSPAVRELLARATGADPAYRSAWPHGWALRTPVRHTAGVITVDLAAGADQPSAALADWAVRQLVYTVQGALGSADPVRILVGGRSVPRLWGRVDIAEPRARDDPYTVRSPVQIDNPGYGARLGRTFRVSGEAAVFEATVLWQVLRGSTVVQHGFTSTAEGQKFSPYSFELTLEPGAYTLRVYQDDASGGEGRPPISDTRPITVH
jgi:Immunoglobulin-like domain of bacterial spore germination/Sporulation and spore germination